MSNYWSRLLILALLLMSACQSAPPVDGTPLPQATDTASPIPPTATAECAPRPALLPTQAAAPPSAVTLTADGLVQGQVLPSPYMIPTQVQAPLAWTRSTGAGITIAVVRNHEEDLALIGLIAPDAQVQALQVDPQLMVQGKALLEVLNQEGIQLLAIPEPADFEEAALLEKVPEMVRAGIAVLINADLGLGAEGRELANALEAGGAITVGRMKYGTRIQGRDSRQRQINLFAGYGEDQKSSEHGAVLTVSAVAALALSARPELDPLALKQHLVDTADLLYTSVNPANNKNSAAGMRIDPVTGEFSPTEASTWIRRVNAAAAVGVHLDEPWPLNAMNVREAWKTATGKGVLVAVLDVGFHYRDPLIQAHTLLKFPEKNFEGEQHFHGTWVTRALLGVAPDVSLVLLNEDDLADYDLMAQNDAQLIDYAILHGVQVLTTSNKSWTNTPEVNAAIDRAIEAGMVVIHSDYTGNNPAVIRPGHWRTSNWDVGTFTLLFDNNKRPVELEAGLSFSPPQIAGIAALILQNEPDLTPMQVKQRIVETASVLPDGGSLADAAAAVQNRPSGRKLATAEAPGGEPGQLRVELQLPDSEERTRIEMAEAHQNWPVAALPLQDILFYRALPSTPGPYAGVSRLVAYRNLSPVLRIEWPGDGLSTGDWPATVSVYPEGEWKPFFVSRLGEEGVLPLHVEVVCGRVHLTWSSAEGAPMMYGYGEQPDLQPSEARLFGFEVETAIMPDLLEPVY